MDRDEFPRLYRTIIGPLTRLVGEMEGAADAANHSDVQSLSDTIEGWSEQTLSIRDAVAEELGFPLLEEPGSGEGSGGE